ncbi:MAG: capsule assembly Wzi family protein [Salinibacter sp.]
MRLRLDLLFRSTVMLFWTGLLCGLLGGAPRPVAAQTKLDSLQTSVTLFGAAGTGEALPFWLTANQYGSFDPTSANAGLHVRASRPFQNTEGLDYAFGIDLLGRASHHATATFQELYGRLRYGTLQLTAGRQKQSIGRVDTTLSLGGVTRSRNAPPLPRLSLSSNGYVSVPGTQKGVAFKGYLAHAWLESDRFVENALVHEKYLYLRLLPPRFPVNGYAGLVHHAQWGGTHPQDGPQQVSIARWFDTLIGDEVLAEYRPEAQSPTFNPNHLAMYDFSLSVDLGELRGLAYRQFYHEDVASFNFRNVWDGLWGVSIRREDSSALVSALLWEHLRMTRHNAKFSQGQERGADSYYNHVHYQSGWTYQGRTLGTPLLTAAATTPGVSDTALGVANNIVVAHHVGVEGHLGAGLSYRLLATYSRNYGAKSLCTACAYQRTDRRDQYSFRMTVRGPLLPEHNLWFRTAAAVDVGEFYNDRIGLSFALTWRRLLRR